MTLVARAKPPAHHKKRSGEHHRRSKQYHKAYWPYLPILLIIFGGFFVNSNLASSHRQAVLAYATDTTIQGLLDGTNTQRVNNGLGSLSLNAQLDQAAQNKANDMVARDYWAHNTPDNQPPWTFITAAGYNYATAGENLAYGYMTSDATVTAWMNSPGHRANILNTSYVEVGFGVANATNYQGTGPETVVVAMYASPASGTATPTTTPSNTPAVQQSTSEPAKSTPAPATQSAPSNEQPTETPTEQQPANDTQAAPTAEPVVTTTQPVKPIVESKPQKVSRLELLTAGKAPWSITVATVLVATGIILLFTRHGIAWHKVIRKGEKFFLHHPILDIVATLVIVVGLVLIQSAGSIR